jgi:arylsulfatase A-like enzyme
MKKFTILVIITGIVVAAGFGIVRALKPKQPNVIIMLLDTLRADHLGVYGYERDTSPHLDAFARESYLFKFAVTAAPWTPPSVLSILSGMYVPSHGLMPPNNREKAKEAKTFLGPEIQTLQKILKARGYYTAAVSPNPWISPTFGFDSDFQQFTYLPRERAEKINEAAFAELTQRHESSDPFFLYLHYLDPHDSYNPPEAFRNLFPDPLRVRSYDPRRTKEMRLYDGEIRYLDSELGKLFQRLKDLGLYENTIIIVVGDHGEQFMEHGFTTHGNQVFNTETHVPLIVKRAYPHAQSGVVDHTVSTIDVFATVLAELGIKSPSNAVLSVPLFDEQSQAKRPGVMSEIHRKLDQRAFVNFEGKKLIIGGNTEGAFPGVDDPMKNIVGVFDSRVDYQEMTPLQDAELLHELQSEYRRLSELASALRVGGSETGAKVSDEMLNQLESLGYLK